MGAHQQAQRVTAAAAELSDALQALSGAATLIEELNRPIASDKLKRVVATIHTQYGRLVDVGDRLRDVVSQIEAPPELTGPLVPCRLVTRTGSPITTMDLPPPRIGEQIQLGANHPWRVVQVKHLRQDAEYAAVVTVEPESPSVLLPRRKLLANEEQHS